MDNVIFDRYQRILRNNLRVYSNEIAMKKNRDFRKIVMNGSNEEAKKAMIEAWTLVIEDTLVGQSVK